MRTPFWVLADSNIQSEYFTNTSHHKPMTSRKAHKLHVAGSLRLDRGIWPGGPRDSCKWSQERKSKLCLGNQVKVLKNSQEEVEGGMETVDITSKL